MHPNDLAPPSDKPGGVRIAGLTGSDSISSVVWGKQGTVAVKGNNDCWRLIDPRVFYFRRFHIAPNYFRGQRRWDFSSYHVVLNLVTDPDQNPKTIEIAERITRGFADHVVNRPKFMLTTTRNEIARRLQGIPQLVVPKVMLLRNATLPRVRALVDEQGFRFPAILRRTGTHSGRVLGVIKHSEDLDSIFGDRENEYFLTEFVDFASPDGLYRKMRLFFIGDDVLFKNLIVSDKWNIHARDRAGIMAERDELRREEQALMDGGFEALRKPLEPGLREIRNRIQLDYLGMDCAPAADGRLVLFELNATMNFFPLPEDPRFAYLNACIAPAQAAMSRLLKSRARSVAPTNETAVRRRP